MAVLVCVNTGEALQSLSSSLAGVSGNVASLTITLPAIQLFFVLLWSSMVPSLWIPWSLRKGVLHYWDCALAAILFAPQIALDSIRIAAFSLGNNRSHPVVQANLSLSIIDLSLIIVLMLICVLGSNYNHPVKGKNSRSWKSLNILLDAHRFVPQNTG